MNMLLLRISLIMSLFLTSGCDKFLSDIIWTHSKIVPINPSATDENIAKILCTIPEISVNEKHSRQGDYILNVKKLMPFPSVGAFVRRINSETVEVVFVGKGTQEPEAERRAITPLLASIAGALERNLPPGK